MPLSDDPFMPDAPDLARRRWRRFLFLGGALVLAVSAGALVWMPAAPSRADRAIGAGMVPVAASGLSDPAVPVPDEPRLRAPADDSLLSVAAPRQKSREEQRFDRVDRDGDGRIRQSEYLATRRRNFDRLDVNDDGRLSFEEYAVAGIRRFDTADSNGDAILSAAEFATTAPKPRTPAQSVAAAGSTAEATAGVCPPCAATLAQGEETGEAGREDGG